MTAATTIVTKTAATTLGHMRLSLPGAQDSSSRTSKCLPILSHYRQPDLQEVLIEDRVPQKSEAGLVGFGMSSRRQQQQ